MRGKSLLLIWLLTFFLLSWCVPYLPVPERPKKPEKTKLVLRRVEWGDVQMKLEPFSRRKSLERAVDASLHYLDKKPRSRPGYQWNRIVSFDEIRKSLVLLKRTISESKDSKDFERLLKERFQPYILSLNHENMERRLLVTGYFQPELRASYIKNDRFSYPLYGLPRNLVKIRINDFDPDLPDRFLVGRIESGRVVPFYTRKEIDFCNRLKGAPVLAWLSSSVEGLALHIQGSGLLIFPDGEKRYVHHAASNGHPYRSIGRWLIEKGYLDKNGLDWPAIEKWARENPELFKQALCVNPRYIFFKWEKEGPIGSLGEVLTPMHSVALDHVYYPPGAIFLLKTVLPQAGGGMLDFSSLVMNQDKGSAIKGLNRIDLYIGEGENAGLIAGKMKYPGELYLLLER